MDVELVTDPQELLVTHQFRHFEESTRSVPGEGKDLFLLLIVPLPLPLPLPLATPSSDSSPNCLERFTLPLASPMPDLIPQLLGC